ncbi:MAG: S-layer homology domain-containing protein, partial [Clostridia bacterium]|nr:S-layer homology domain-containing protein [Clostridia bacterium]
NFSGGLARISAQIRIDGEAAKEYVLSNDTKVKVNGEEWTVSGVRVEDGCSYGHIQSPQIVPVPTEEAPTFTVTFDSKGGSKVEPVTGQYYAYGIAEFEDPVRSGYKFDGWYKDEQYSEKFIFINNTNDVMGGYDRVYENITLYAKWEKNSKEEQESPSQTEKPVQTEKPQETEKPAEKPTQTEKPQETPMMSFVDVEKGQYYYDAVMWAVENGITSGTGVNTFSPDSICTRAQVVTFLHRMIASPEPTAIDMPFVDVKEGAFYYKPVKWALGSKITGGTSENTFSPDDNCTRAQVVTFLWRTAGQPKSTVKNNPFTDVKADMYYYDAVLWAVENGITGGTSADTFSPDSNCTRAQVVTFLYRFITKK